MRLCFHRGRKIGCPGLLQLEPALSRPFTVKERYRLEVFNVIDLTNFAALASTLSSTSFGRMTS